MTQRTKKTRASNASADREGVASAHRPGTGEDSPRGASLSTGAPAAAPAGGLVDAEVKSPRVGLEPQGPSGECDGGSSPVGESLEPLSACPRCRTHLGIVDRITCRVCGALYSRVSDGALAAAIGNLASRWVFEIDRSSKAIERAYVLVCAAELIGSAELPRRYAANKIGLALHGLARMQEAVCVRPTVMAGFRSILAEAEIRIRRRFEVYGCSNVVGG